MTTTLKKFTEAYASMTVAVYEPIIARWISGWSVYVISDALAWRLQKAKYMKIEGAFATAQALNIGRFRRGLPPTPKGLVSKLPLVAQATLDLFGRSLSKEAIRPVTLKGFPEAVALGDKIYPRGVPNFQAGTESTRAIGSAVARPPRAPGGAQVGDISLGARSIPTFLSGQVAPLDADFDFRQARNQLFLRLTEAAKTSLHQGMPLGPALHDALRNVGGLQVFDFLPVLSVEEALSPIGVAHYYRQLYFNKEEGVGPVEEAFTIAPLETLEVVYQSSRRQIHEEFIEEGSEVVSETAQETKNLDEVSDKVSNMVQRDSSASMSANASGTIGVWQVGGSTSANMSVSTQRSREEAARRVKEVTRRASERITKTFSIKTRDFEEVTTTSLTRRVIRNELERPVSYGLRRVLRRVHVKLQALGPRAVWQLYLRNPGEGLARSRFVHFREAEPIAVPERPPGLEPRPSGGTDTGTGSSDLTWDETHETYYVTLVILPGMDRRVTAVSIDSISDLEGGGKDDPAPSARNEVQWGKNVDETTNSFTVNIGVLEGDAMSVSVSYTYTWEPAPHVLQQWEMQRQKAVAALTQELLNEQFEREKTLITERSKIRPRPANDLRREERFEVLNRMISHLFAQGDDPSDPAPIEIEYFHRFFEIDGMFVYMHPSWWKPRYTPAATGLERPAYEITAESEPAPLGSSLGWMIQLDGDARRNEFINSPWVRACIPVRPAREREAVAWLARHVEGEFGYDPSQSPLKDVLLYLDEVRKNEASLGMDGPNYVTVDSTVGAPEDPLSPEGIYPIVDEFDVTVPTDGFVYDALEVAIP